MAEKKLGNTVREASIRATYRVPGAVRAGGRTARAIAFEQTVELPEALVTDPAIRERIVGEVESVVPDPEMSEASRVIIAYNAELAVGGLGALFNLLYGNVSMYRGVRLLAAELPDALLAQFRGPRYGIGGLRELIGVHDRPLLATALKPRGSPVAALARMAEAFALAGGDIVKDDQNLVDDSFDAFRLRVDACAAAVEQANAKTGRRTLYLPHLAGRDGNLERSAEFIHARGLAGALICPLATGLDRARALADRYGLVFMAHPSLAGGFTQGEGSGVAPDLLLGTLFRLAGADISIFPAPGGRFDVSPVQCGVIADALRCPLGELRPALPAPSGGMRLEKAFDLADVYGADSVWLVGGALHGYDGGIPEGTREFLAALRARFPERLVEPGGEYVSACELSSVGAADLRALIPALEDFRWEGRKDQVYKKTRELDFRGVRRVELVGKNGERCGFELRYFELEPGGYTSREKHVHTHVLIGARGRGVVLTNAERRELKSDDVAYVAPLEVHQLRNESDAPFGFYCIVDRGRDRPMAP
ncbi:MAG: RuBisCO large subunit C-terminal-like domain-containing protein [Gammaproteobacteria bacterium]